MSDKPIRDPYKGPTPTRPKQQPVPAPMGAHQPLQSISNDDPTLNRCPHCLGTGAVLPEQVDLYDRMCEHYKESQ